MKTLLLAGLLLAGLSSCSKKDDVAPVLTPQQQQQQLLLGTWKLEKDVFMHNTTSGVLVFQDSTIYLTPDPNYTITYKADGTTISGVGITSFYTYSPPALVVGVADPNFTTEVIQLTAQKCVLSTRMVTSGAIIKSKLYYGK